jgi:hypothetical protein
MALSRVQAVVRLSFPLCCSAAARSGIFKHQRSDFALIHVFFSLLVLILACAELSICTITCILYHTAARCSTFRLVAQKGSYVSTTARCLGALTPGPSTTVRSASSDATGLDDEEIRRKLNDFNDLFGEARADVSIRYLSSNFCATVC